MSPAAPVQFAIDGRWVTAIPAGDFGGLGQRFVCDLVATEGKPPKKMLLRLQEWPQSGSATVPLALEVQTGSLKNDIRPAKVKAYRRNTPLADGKSEMPNCQVLQQDISGLVPLKNAILNAVKKGEPHRIGRLFFACCHALDRFGKSFAPDKPIPLQAPGSLAIGPKYRAIPLDAEIRSRTPLDETPEAKQIFGPWFGDALGNGFAGRNDASRKHVDALRLYFRQVLAAAHQHATHEAQPMIAEFAQRLGQLPPDMPLDEMEAWIRDNNQDWSLPVEEEERASHFDVVPDSASTAVPPVLLMSDAAEAPVRPRKRSLLLRMSLWLNLLLTVAIIVMILLWPKIVAGSKGADEKGALESGVPPHFDSAVLFSSYCVVFPTQGTIGEKVNTSLFELFPDKVAEVRGGTTAQEKQLSNKLEEVSKSVPNPEKLKQLLVELASRHAVRFKGFNAESGESLDAIIRRGGVFTISGGREEHGTLLQSTAVDNILRKASVSNQKEARSLLAGLRLAVAEYASLKDVLSIIGERPAFLVRIEPTAAGHEETRRKLLSRVDKPVYSSRPIPALFDAIDPTADTGGGSAEYRLRLERKSFWRQAGVDDRKKVNFVGNKSNDQMRWQSFNAGQEIFWRPIPLTHLDGRTAAVASFDIAVVLENRMVVFRNQSIFVGATRADVLEQGKKYINEYLKLSAREIEEAFTVKESGDQFTGVLNYSYLADLVVPATPACDDLKVLERAAFDMLKITEDKVLNR